jgi:hypothetical protein
MTEGKLLNMAGWLENDKTDGYKEICENARKYLNVRSLSAVGGKISNEARKKILSGGGANRPPC